MSGLRRMAAWGAAGALCLVVLLAFVGALSPRWINGKPARERIAAYLSQAIGGTVEFRRIDLSWLPAPRAVVHEVTASVPGKWSGSARSLAVYPGILPLLRGKLVPARVRLDEPELRADLEALAGRAREEPMTLADAREKTAALLAAVSAKAPGLVIDADKGRVALFRGADPLVALRNFEGRLTMPPGRLGADVRFAWSAGATLSLKGALDASTLDGRAEIVVARLDAAALARFLSPSAAIALEKAEVDAAASIETAGLRSVRAAIRGSAPSVALRRGGRTFVARALRFRGSVDAGPGKLAATLSELAVGSPPLRASGTLVASVPSRRAALSLDARETNVETVRDALLFFSGDAAPVRDAFSRIEGGALPSLTVAAEWSAPFDPAAIENLALAARLRDGTVRVREAGLLFTDVAADVAVRRGVLSAGRISARLGRSKVRDGTLSLGLSGESIPFRAALSVDADLQDIPPILARVVGSAPLDRELSLVEGLEGRAAGRLLLGDRIESLKATVDVSDMRFSARYGRFPFPIRIAAGRFFYEGGRIAVRGMTGSAGRSTFADVAVTLRTGPPVALEEASGRHSLALGELHPWLSSLPGMEALSREVRALDGTLEADIRTLSGRVDRPRDWRCEAEGSFKGVAMNAARLPGELAVATGRFRILPDALSFTGVNARLLDGALAVSGALRPPFGNPRRIEAAGDGSLGPDSVRWLSSLLGVPPALAVRAPIAVAGARVAWSADNAVSAAGTLTVAAGPTVSVDLRRRAGELDIRDLSVRDDESRAAASLALTKDALGFSFTGRLTGGTLGRLFVRENLPPEFRVDGDISVYAPREHPGRATATGRLEATGIRIPEFLGPLAIEKLSMEAKGNRVAVKPSALAWGTTRFTLAGSAESSEGGLRVDMDVGAGAVDWAAIRGAVKARGSETGLSRIPKVTGAVRVAAASVADGPRTWTPFRADVALDLDATRISIRQAGLCGIEARGEVTIAPAETAVDVRASAAGSDVGPLLSCLRGEHVKMTGRYELAVRVAGRGTDETLLRALSGSVAFRATGGRIFKATLLSKILAVLNVTQILFGKFPDIAHEGFAYNSLGIRGDVREGKLVLREATLDAASANLSGEGSYDFTADRLDVVILASPLKTVDAILRRIPVVGYILGGSLVSVPFQVTGNPHDPAVTVLPPAQVGKGILGVVERTLKAPVKLIAPILPKETPK